MLPLLGKIDFFVKWKLKLDSYSVVCKFSLVEDWTLKAPGEVPMG